MTRVKTGVIRRRRHQKVVKATKGYYGTRSKLYRRANEAYLRAGEHAFAGRRLRRRDLRRLWIQRINAALKEHQTAYSRFIKDLKRAKIDLDRKILADLANAEPEVFKEIVKRTTA